MTTEIDIIAFAKLAIGDVPLSDARGLVERKLRSEYNDKRIVIDSVKSSLSHDTIFKYALLEVINHNNSVIFDRFGLKRKAESAMPRQIPIAGCFDVSRLKGIVIPAEIPGRHNVIVDLSSLVRAAFKNPNKPLDAIWRELARFILHRTMPISHICLYTLYPQRSRKSPSEAYIRLSLGYINAIKSAACIASYFLDAPAARYFPPIGEAIDKSLQQAIFDARKSQKGEEEQKKTFEDYLLHAKYEGWIDSRSNEHQEKIAEEIDVNHQSEFLHSLQSHRLEFDESVRKELEKLSLEQEFEVLCDPTGQYSMFSRTISGRSDKFPGISDTQNALSDEVETMLWTTSLPTGLSPTLNACHLKEIAKTVHLNGIDVMNIEGIKHVTGQQKIKESARAKSAESGGRRCLKSVHGSYLRAIETEWNVDMVKRAPRAWENWYIEDWGENVVLKARGGPNKPGQFLRAQWDGSVDLTGAHPKDCALAIWKPVKNDNGSWSFLSAHETWLSARDDGSVSTVDKRDSWEHFWLETW